METNTASGSTTNVKVATELPVAKVQRATIQSGSRGLVLCDLDAMWRFSVVAQKSGLAPKGFQTTESIFIAVQMGAEVGLPPMASLQNIAVINGRPSIWGDAQLGVVRSTGQLEEFAEWFEIGNKKLARVPVEFPDSLTAVCRAKRAGYPAQESSFSVADAKRAGLWGKESPWKYYPARMLQMRARSFALRDQFGDALKGLRCAEDVIGETIDVRDVESRQVTVIAEPAESQVIDVPSEPVKESVREPKTELESPPEPKSDPSPQDRLMLYLCDFDISLEQFASWAIKTGNLDAAPARWDDIPSEVATRLWTGRKPMANAIKAMK